MDAGGEGMQQVTKSEFGTSSMDCLMSEASQSGMATSSLKPSNMDGTEATTHVAKPSSVRPSDLILRVLIAITCLVSIILLATSKETKTVPITIIPSLPAVDVEVTSKWQYSSAFVYLMVINIVTLVYAVISVGLSIVTGAGSKGLGLLLIILDLMVMALMFSANGAAAGVAYIGYHGNSHARWNKICNVFGKNCRIVAASILLSLIGSVLFLLLIVLTMANLRRRSR